MFTKRGAAAVESAQAEKDTKASAMVKFTSGTTLKVRVKSKEDSVEYYAYSVFGKVDTFVPKEPASRNEKGYVTSGATPWDLAADAIYADAKALKDGGDEAGAESLRNQAYLLKGKPKYLVGFGNLADGTDIVVDLTPKQAASVFAAIKKYEKKLGTLAFELAKTGSSTNTVVSFSPILDMDEDLTEAERANFEKAGATPFDFEIFETCLYVADDAEQVKNLVIAGFDIGRLGLSIGANAGTNASPPKDDEAPPITGEAPAVNF
jgi:hypothetical protein